MTRGIVHGKNIAYDSGDQLAVAAFTFLSELDKKVFGGVYLLKARTMPYAFEIIFEGHKKQVKLHAIKGLNTIITD